MPLYAHQQKFLKENKDKTALVWSCGTGKTRAALEWARFRKSTLIICPKSLKSNWRREANRYGLSFEYHHPVPIVTKEEFRKDYKKLPKYDNIIVDEVHNGFLTPHFKSQMSKALRDYLKKWNTERVLLLSATVYTSSPWNIFQLAFLLGHKWNWQEFNVKFFNQVWMGQRQIPVPKKGCEQKLAELTKKIASVVNIYDCMDVPLQQHLEPEYFALTPEQERAIKKNDDPLPIVKYTMQHEIENGILLGNEFRASQTFKCDKNDRILALVEENPKVAIVARYNAQIDELARLLASYKPYIIRGDVKDRDSVCLAAEKADTAVVLIQADSVEGYNLPSFGLCVFASMSYSYAKKQQVEGRFLRADKPSRTTFIYLLTEGDSIDRAIYNCILKKEDFSIALYKK